MWLLEWFWSLLHVNIYFSKVNSKLTNICHRNSICFMELMDCLVTVGERRCKRRTLSIQSSVWVCNLGIPKSRRSRPSLKIASFTFSLLESCLYCLGSSNTVYKSSTTGPAAGWAPTSSGWFCDYMSIFPMTFNSLSAILVKVLQVHFRRWPAHKQSSYF